MEETLDLLTSEDLQVFDEGQREVLLTLNKRMNDAVDRKVAAQMKEIKNDADFVEMNDEEFAFLKKDESRLSKALDIWQSNGKIPGTQDTLTLAEFMELDTKYAKEAQDNLSSTDHPLLIPRVVAEVVKEAIEPNIVLTPMLQTINYSHGTQLTFPAMGAIAAADIPEGGEYPERSLDFAGQVVATIGKSGLAVKMTEEMIRYSLYDVMSLHLQAAGRALIRWKEQKVADQIISDAGTTNTLFDNTSVNFKSTTGRNANGAYNGTLTLDDIFTAYATFINRGFTPNTMIMNPFAWQLFADEGLQRLFGFSNGGAMWQTLVGNPGIAKQWGNGSFGNALLNNTTVTSPQNIANTSTPLPAIFPYAFQIVVSPYMPFYATSNTTDIIFCDRSELGVLVVDETVTTDSWDDPARDIRKVKLRERYGLGSSNEGKGSGILRGISLDRAFDFAHNIQTTIATSGLINNLVGDTGAYSGSITNQS